MTPKRAKQIKRELDEIISNMGDSIHQLDSIIREMDDRNAEAYLLRGLQNLVDKERFGILSHDLDINGLRDRVDDCIIDEE
jgi:uncharacterized membrane protein